MKWWERIAWNGLLCSCLEEGDLCIKKSELIQVEGTKKGRGDRKNINSSKKKKSIKKVTKRMISDRIETNTCCQS